MVRKFFEQLAGYYYKENDLSNVVVALCNSNEEFKYKFVRFFFPDIDVANIESITREEPDKNNLGSRVDIYITMCDEKMPYIIEVKIGDRSHHFGQYEEAYEIGRERFGYITNYDCVEGWALGYDVKTWEGFYDYLLAADGQDEMIEAFALYLKKVCGIIKYDKPMNFSGLDSITCFVDTAEKIIKKERNWVVTPLYNRSVYACKQSINVGFFVNFPDAEKDGFAYYGLWFSEKPIIAIGITSRSWLSELIMSDKANFALNTAVSKPPYQEEFWAKDDVWFEMSDQLMQKFQSATTYDQQHNMLNEFFEEVLHSLKKYF